jgi:hypothetical protein
MSLLFKSNQTKKQQLAGKGSWRLAAMTLR